MKKENTNKYQLNIILPIAFFITFILIFFIIIMLKYSELENNINKKDIKTLVDRIQTNLEYNHKIILEYSTSDNTYNFIKNENKDYIYTNFRKGSYTLEDVGLSYFILTNKENNIKYSTFTKDIKKEETKGFSDYIIEKLKYTNKINKVIIYQKQAYYLSKTPVYKTDYENSSNGFLYVGSKIDINKLKDSLKNFLKINFISNPGIRIKDSNYDEKRTVSLTTKARNSIKNNIHYNEISFYDKNANLIFTVKVENKIDLLNDLKGIILIIFVSLIIFVIFLVLFIQNKYKNKLISQYDLIDEKVVERTNQMKEEISELQKKNKNLYNLAHTDFLTKTMNRRNFFIHAQKHFLNAKKNNQLLSIVMIDIDNFKKFNDKHGHHIGDKVLFLFAQKIKNSITEKTIFGRLGGEEFALLINNTKLEDAIIKAERLKQNVEEIELNVEGEILKITASFGVSDNVNSSNIDDMLQKADLLLYSAKESGRNLVRSRLNLY